MGERTALWPQANSTACGLDGAASTTRSSLPVQDANEREQTASGVEIDLHLELEALHQELRALVMQAAPAQVERLDALGRRRADGVVVAVADDEIVAHDPAQRRQRE